MSVMMRSVMETGTGGGYKYCFFIFHRNLDAENIETLKTLVEPFSLFSISFVDVCEYFENKKLKEFGHITVATYFRLAAPYILTNYKKILYFDCDMVCRADVCGLYEIDLQGNLVGAVSQLNIYQYQNKKTPPELAKLNLKNPEKYFNSGLLVMNAELFRETVKLEDMLTMAENKQMNDQDLLNCVCDGRTFYLPYHWNYIMDYSHVYLPEEQKRQYIEYGKNPSIIHFQPWTHIIPTLYSRYFWDCASRTPFYARIKQIKRTNFTKNLKKYIRHGINYIRHCGIKSIIGIARDAVKGSSALK
jgi:lipopolysaccharide biosynthesis glycosyltransferase